MQTPAPGEPTQSQPAPPPPPGPPPGYAAPQYGSPQAGQWPGQQPQQFAPVAGPAPGLAYAGFWLRVLALIIDYIIVGAVFFIGSKLFVKGIDYGNGNIVITDGQWFWYLWGILSFFYYPVTWAWLGETPGHRILGMELRRVEDGQKPTGGQIVIRYLGYILSGLIIGIGFLIAAFDARKQGLHDKLAGTVVVRKVSA
jgi:uncharacterized RDD family membrane protein YckC